MLSGAGTKIIAYRKRKKILPGALLKNGIKFTCQGEYYSDIAAMMFRAPRLKY